MIVYSNGGWGAGGDVQFQFVRKLKVTRKYWANCRIHAGMRKKIKTNETFCSKSGETFNSAKKTELD